MLCFFCSLDGEQTPLGTFSLNHFHHPWEILYKIHPFCIIHYLLLFSLFIQISPFFYIPDSSNAGRFPQQEGKSNHVFSVPQMSKSFCKRFFFLVPLSSTLRYYMIFIHPGNKTLFTIHPSAKYFKTI